MPPLRRSKQVQVLMLLTEGARLMALQCTGPVEGADGSATHQSGYAAELMSMT